MKPQIGRRDFLKSCIAGAAVATLPGCSGFNLNKKPNFVFFLIDDLGWTDLGCYGSTFYETPNIDKLAAAGMKFTDAYAACPVCSPTRASILSGKHPARVGITDWIPGDDPKKRIATRKLDFSKSELPKRMGITLIKLLIIVDLAR